MKFKASDIGKKFYVAAYVVSPPTEKSISFEIADNLIFDSIELKRVIASDGSKDRHGENISQDGWQLGEFKKNPVMLWAHDSYTPAIGTWSNPRLEGKGIDRKLVMDPVFDKNQGDSLADLIAGKVERGIIRAVSVGFIPLKFDENFNSIEQELIETSWVNIGANRNALNQDKKEASKNSLIIEEYLLNKYSTER